MCLCSTLTCPCKCIVQDNAIRVYQDPLSWSAVIFCIQTNYSGYELGDALITKNYRPELELEP